MSLVACVLISGWLSLFAYGLGRKSYAAKAKECEMLWKILRCHSNVYEHFKQQREDLIKNAKENS